MTLMIRLSATVRQAAAICSDHDVIAMRRRRLSSIQDGLLVEFLAVPHDGGLPAIGALIYRPGRLNLLIGQSFVLHRLVAVGAVILETAEQALEYCQLFCASVQGEKGCFSPCQSETLRRPTKDDPALSASLQRLDTPPSVRWTDERWHIDMVVSYAGDFFQSKFSLGKNGGIEMLEDDQILGVAAAFYQIWDRGLRYDRVLDDK